MKIEVRYYAKWQLKTNHNYKWTTCKKLINCQTGREIKRTIKGLQAGYWIGKDFIKLKDMERLVTKIKETEKIPF